MFLILGVLAVTEMVLQFTVIGNVYVDPFGPVFILMGRGLLLKRATWRYWAVLVCWFVAAGWSHLSNTPGLMDATGFNRHVRYDWYHKKQPDASPHLPALRFEALEELGHQ